MTRVARYGAAAGEPAARLLRAAGIALLAVILALLVATLPPVDSGGRVATAFADDGDRGDRGGMGGVRPGTSAGEDDDDLDADDDDQGEDGDRDDAGDDADDDGSGGNGGGIGNGGGNGNGGNGGGQSGDGDSGITAERGDKGGRGNDGRDRGGDRDAGAASRDSATDSLEDWAPAARASAALDALRATVLSADEEAAAIANGWTPAD